MLNLLAYILISLCSLFGVNADHYALSNSVDINNTNHVLVANSANFGNFTIFADRCNYQIIVIEFDNENTDLVFHRNCNKTYFGAYFALTLPEFEQTEY